VRAGRNYFRAHMTHRCLRRLLPYRGKIMSIDEELFDCPFVEVALAPKRYAPRRLRTCSGAVEVAKCGITV
jgi:hypothetical protein